MSYEAALAQWKTETSEPELPAEQDVMQAFVAGGDPRILTMGQTWWIRGCLGVVMLGFATMAGLEVQLEAQGGRVFAVLLPIVSLMLAARWLQVRELGKQMMLRALVWSALVIGVLVSVFGLQDYAWTGLPISLGAGAALLLMNGRGLGLTSPSFRPQAFRGHLLIALVLATADAQTLLFSMALKFGVFAQRIMFSSSAAGISLGELVTDPGVWSSLFAQTFPLMVCSAVMVGAVVGLYRLRTWALLLNLVANVCIASLAMSGAIGLTLPVAAALATTATMQLLLPVPILASALGDKLRDRQPWGRFGAPAVKVGLVVMTLVGIVGPLLPERVQEGAGYVVVRTGWVERTYRAQTRGLFGSGVRQSAQQRNPTAE
ncbi:MAG: hypothetical protein KUG77_15870 [Nannocystaceae bacterium]|nr:hypothetical protein [Nannocystaceae bacterium]